jgi:hypothetical protein
MTASPVDSIRDSMEILRPFLKEEKKRRKEGRCFSVKAWFQAKWYRSRWKGYDWMD